MPPLSVEKALAYLDALEADRKTALALSEQKAEEAKLIKARQEGFQAAMEIFGGEFLVRRMGAHPEFKEPGRRRGRRPIRQLILRELSFSGEPMTTAKIAKAIEYNGERTETALKRMEGAGQVLQDEEGQWAIVLAVRTKFNWNAVL
jgi:hypothetical protein